VPISSVNQVTINALNYAKTIARAGVTAVYVDFDQELTQALHEQWQQWQPADIELIVLPTPYRSFVQPIMRLIEEVEARSADEVVTVVIPEYIPARCWQNFLNNQSSLLLKGVLLFKERVIVVSVPYQLKNY